MLPCYTIVRVANDGTNETVVAGDNLDTMGILLDGYERLFRAEPEPPREVYLMAEPVVTCVPLPTDTLSEEANGDNQYFRYLLVVERGNGTVSRFWGSDDLDALEALQRALTPLLIETNRYVLPGDHAVRSVIYAREVLDRRVLGVRGGDGNA